MLTLFPMSLDGSDGSAHTENDQSTIGEQQIGETRKRPVLSWFRTDNTMDQHDYAARRDQEDRLRQTKGRSFIPTLPEKQPTGIPGATETVIPVLMMPVRNGVNKTMGAIE